MGASMGAGGPRTCLNTQPAQTLDHPVGQGSEGLGDVLDACVVLEAVDAEVLAVAAEPEAAMRQLAAHRGVDVDAGRTEVQVSEEAGGAPMVRGPDACRQAVRDSVGELES